MSRADSGSREMPHRRYEAAHPAEQLRELCVGLFPTLGCHAGISMQLYGRDLVESLKIASGIRAELLVPPFDSDVAVGGMRRRWVRYVNYPVWARRLKFDVYHIVDHGNAQLLLAVAGAKTVVTCHDLFPMAISSGRLRFQGAPSRRAMFPTSLRLTLLRRASAIVGISKFTLDECQTYLRVPASRLYLAHYGIAEEFTAGDDGAHEAVRSRLGIRADDLVILHVGSNDPRKNIATLLRVMACVREKGGPRIRLLKVGTKLGAAERRVAGGLHVEDAIVEVGEVPVSEVALIYRIATVLLYPSFHEGFCRPVAEAMAAGLPVVASRCGAIPEIAGGAAALYDPEDVEGMADRVVAIAESAALREDMAAAGRENASRFTWQRHGKAVAEVYRAIACS